MPLFPKVTPGAMYGSDIFFSSYFMKSGVPVGQVARGSTDVVHVVEARSLRGLIEYEFEVGTGFDLPTQNQVNGSLLFKHQSISNTWSARLYLPITQRWNSDTAVLQCDRATPVMRARVVVEGLCYRAKLTDGSWGVNQNVHGASDVPTDIKVV
jgi:hypothetical protein